MASILETIGPRSGAAPYTFTLTEEGTVDIQSVFAHFDGTSASGTFLPVLTIRAQNGSILGRWFPTDDIAAGSSAEVTYSPFFRRSATTPAATYASTILATPCIAHYFPASEAAGTLADSSGAWSLAPVTGGGFPTYGADGPIPSEPALTAVVNDGAQGVAGNPARFQYAYTGAPWAGTSDFTVEMWVYATNYATSGALQLLDSGSAGGDVSLLINGSPGKITFARSGTGITDTTNFPLNSWQYIVARYVSGTMNLFRNGALVATGAGAGSLSLNGTVSWLNRFQSAWAPFRGRGAQLAIYDCGLSDANIAAHYALGT